MGRLLVIMEINVTARVSQVRVLLSSSNYGLISFSYKNPATWHTMHQILSMLNFSDTNGKQSPPCPSVQNDHL